RRSALRLRNKIPTRRARGERTVSESAPSSRPPSIRRPSSRGRRRMSSDLDYARVTIDLPQNADTRRIWRQLGGLDGHIAVNVIDATGQPALITDAVVAELQTVGRGAVAVDALPELRYLEIATRKLDLALADVPTLRAAWRTRPIGDTAATLQTLLQ